jgi:hypothetical protein
MMLLTSSTNPNGMKACFLSGSAKYMDYIIVLLFKNYILIEIAIAFAMLEITVVMNDYC